MKKTIYTITFLLLAQFSFLNAFVCPDPPINDDPCITSDFPPIDLTGSGTHLGTTCCATSDLDNIDCSDPTGASVWYIFTPDANDIGYDILLTPSGDGAEGPISVEVYSGLVDQGCNGGFDTTLASSCSNTDVHFKIGNCFDAGEVIFIKVSTNGAEDNCGEFQLSINPGTNDLLADNCFDLASQLPIAPITESSFAINYLCTQGSLDYACSENVGIGGCSAFQEMPTVWFHVVTDENASQMFTTVETNGTWDAIWSVYSGPDCDNLSLITAQGAVPCSNDDNTPHLHQTPIVEGASNYWIMVTADPNSVFSSGLGDGTFELCVSTTIDAFVCLGELEGGSCNDESLIIEIIERDNEDLPLDGPFCQGEEVTIHISFLYDSQESGADWFMGFVPKFGSGWDLDQFDFDANAPIGNGQIGQWYEEGTELAPIIQEPVPILCTYRDEDGVLQICNQLCSPCLECEQQGMQEGDPLPSGYFWVSNGGSPGCANDGSPGEGWGIGSVSAQIDWTFTLRVKTFDNPEECLAKNDLNISFQTFTDGVAGCWEDPEGVCLLDRAMVGPAWTIGCSEVPPGIIADDMAICTNTLVDIPVNTEDGSALIIVVKAIENSFITGANDYVFEGGIGEISDFLENTNTTDEIQSYEVYVSDPNLVCQGPKRIVEVIVYAQNMNDIQEVICTCEEGCSTIGQEAEEGSTYFWSTGETNSMITVCPIVPTDYVLTIIDVNGCEQYGTYFVDCEALSPVCNEENLLANENCEAISEMDIICDISILGTFYSAMPSAPSIGIQPDPLCPDGGNPENISWFAFLAYEGEYALIISPGGCNGSTTGMEGIQVGIYTDCTFSESVFCHPDCSEEPITLTSDHLVPGQIYYLFIDGCGGSVCSYTIDIEGNPIPPNSDVNELCILDEGITLCEDSAFNTDDEIVFQVADLDFALEYTWEITTISGVPYEGDPSPITQESNLDLTFGTEGVYQVCLISVSFPCPQLNWFGQACRTVTINETVGLEDLEMTHLQITPSPALDYITVNGNIPFIEANYSIYAIDGQRVKSGKLDTSQKVDVLDLPEGLYVIRIVDTSAKNELIGRFVKSE
jgi:hypothetical protein